MVKRREEKGREGKRREEKGREEKARTALTARTIPPQATLY
jgi:hypothetical protein